MDGTSFRRWAVEEFGEASLGDERRRRRLLGMAQAAARRPSGRLSDVFDEPREREGAYDFLESPHVHASALQQASARACAQRCADEPLVFVPVDGSSLTLADKRLSKDFGALGSRAKGRGIKVMSAIALSEQGTPQGLCAQRWWVRTGPKHRKRSKARRRPVHQKETQHWIDVVTETSKCFAEHAPSTRLCFVMDREANSWPVLEAGCQSDHWIIVRASRDRRLLQPGDGSMRLRQVMSAQQALGHYDLHLRIGPERLERTARIQVRAACVTLDLRDAYSKKRRPAQTMYAVWVREQVPPKGHKPLDWLLLTNMPVRNFQDACRVVYGYTLRWRIEDFHKTWKSGQCGIESTQLRRKDHVVKWATLLAAVAVRTERLKHLARNEPQAPASQELSIYEINALLLWKHEHLRRDEPKPRKMPTIEQATLWIALMGGYIQQKSNGPPGSITIGRGLQRLIQRAQVLRSLRATPILPPPKRARPPLR